MLFDGLQVFSATKHRDRAELGERVTDWLSEHPVDIVDKVIVQSSDNSFHCITIVLFYKER